MSTVFERFYTSQKKGLYFVIVFHFLYQSFSFQQTHMEDDVGSKKGLRFKIRIFNGLRRMVDSGHQRKGNFGHQRGLRFKFIGYRRNKRYSK